jgi:hypothetical protein
VSSSIRFSEAHSHDLVDLSALFRLTERTPDKDRMLSGEFHIERWLSRLANREGNELATPAIEPKVHYSNSPHLNRHRLVKGRYVDDLSLHSPTFQGHTIGNACDLYLPSSITS